MKRKGSEIRTDIIDFRGFGTHMRPQLGAGGYNSLKLREDMGAGESRVESRFHVNVSDRHGCERDWVAWVE